MKKLVLLFLLLLFAFTCFPQRTLLVEKIGTSHKYYYRQGDLFKLRKKSDDSIIKGTLWSIGGQSLDIFGKTTVEIPVSNIRIVYKRYNFLTASAFTFAQASVYYFLAISVNHLINKEQVLTKDVWIMSGACLAAATLCFSFSEKRCRIGDRWKIKILDIQVR